MDTTIDNQQERLFDIGWLTAAIEGEGTLTIIKSYATWKGEPIYIPTCRISNTKENFIRNVERICKENEIGVHVGNRKPHGNRQIIWIARIQGLRRCLKLLDTIQKRMYIKKDNAEIMREFIEHRLSLPNKTPHGEYEENLRIKIQSLNKNGGNKNRKESSETIRWTPEGDEDIVRTSNES